jgi:hypothetical protein
MKKIIALLVGLGFVFGLAGMVNPGSALAADKAPMKKLVVKLGTTAAKAKAIKKHDITMADLEKGKMDYTVQDKKGQKYKVTLTEQQVKDILAGTTVMADTEGGKMKVQITAMEEKKKKSGW